ncbi:MAG: acetyl ornithine aminotransferase family protein [Deltaproteobacteria bacterium]|nr:acetyl ornithine aminotransferase family protein [Deltaproteobacteria bacterium]
MSRRPTLRTELPGPLARALIDRSNAAVSPSYTRDHPLVAERAEGVWITDPDGNEFLDMSAGIAVTSTGHCHPRVVAAIQEQAAKLIHMSGTDFFYPVQGRLADRLVKMQPVVGDKCRVYFGNSGTEANEAAMKLARFYTGRKQFVAFLDAFHGRTLGALSLTASKARQREGFGPFFPVTHGIYPDPYRMGANATQMALDHLDNLFRTTCPPEDVAALFVEPVQGEGGYIIPPSDWLAALRALCDRHGILLVFDEVQCGMGRTGKMFAFEHWGVKPDIITLAKGIASGMPLSATIASERLMQWKPGAHASTFGGNPIACAAAHATLDLLEESLVDNSARVGEQMMGMLRDALGAHPYVGDIRGKGLMIGVELVRDRASKERASDFRNALVMDCFYRSGMVVLGAGRNAVRFCPALTLSVEEAQTAVDLFATSLHALTQV